jgi:hypothetical protein
MSPRVSLRSHRLSSLRHPSLSLRSPNVAALLLLAAIALAGCGSTHKSAAPTAGLASDVPASAPLFVEATVRPDGALKVGALAAGQALTHHADPYLSLLAALRSPGSPALDFSRDVAPWLGTRAGIFLSSPGETSQLLSLLQQGLLGSSSAASAWPFGAKGSAAGTAGAQGAIMLDTSNPQGARSFIATQAQRAGAHATSYRGVAYYLAPSSGAAFGIVGGFAVMGSETGLHSVIDTSLGGSSLARAAGYAKLLSDAPPGALAHLYTNPTTSTAGNPSAPASTGTASTGTSSTANSPTGASGASQSGGASGLAGLLRLLAGKREANLSLLTSSTSLTLDADTLSSGPAAHTGGLLSSGSAGVRTLGELPGESWLAVGLGEVGNTLGTDVQSLGEVITTAGGGPPESATSSFTVRGVLAGITAPLNALSANDSEASHAAQSWMGPAGLFASGNGVVSLRAAIVIASHNPAGSRAAVAKLAGLLNKNGNSAATTSIPGTDAAISARVNGLPVELDIAVGRATDGQTKFVIGLGEASVQDALHPSSTLSSTAGFHTTVATLGESAQPTLTANFPELVGLLEGVGLSEDPSISGLVPYLRTLTTLAGGSHSLGGGVERVRLVAGLQQPEAG